MRRGWGDKLRAFVHETTAVDVQLNYGHGSHLLLPQRIRVEWHSVLWWVWSHCRMYKKRLLRLLMKIDLNSNFHSFSCHLHFLSTTVDYFRNTAQTSTNVKINQTCVAVANVSICPARTVAIVTRDFDSTASDVKVSFNLVFIIRNWRRFHFHENFFAMIFEWYWHFFSSDKLFH